MNALLNALFLFSLLFFLPAIFQGANMQEEEFYNLPGNSKIAEIKYIPGKGFAAIDRNGNKLFVIFTYDNGPDYVSEGLIRIIDNDKIGFANLEGKIVLTPQFDAALPFNEGLSAVCTGCSKVKVNEHVELRGGKWGYVDKKGELVIPYKYDRVIENFKNGIAVVEMNDKEIQINKNGEEAKGDEMNYAEWINILGKVAELISKLYLSENYTVQNVYDGNESYIFPGNDIRYLKIRLLSRTENKTLVEFNIIPWSDFILAGGDKDFPNPRLTNKFVIATEFAIIYQPYKLTGAGTEELKEREKFEELVKDALNYNAIHQLQEEELNIPEDVQVISTKVFNYYVDLQIAIPGSRLPDKADWRKDCKDRMLHLHLVPDTGEVKSSWIKTAPDAMNVYYTSVEDPLLKIFDEAIERALREPNNREKIYEEGKEKIRALFNAANSFVNVLNDRYERRLSRWLMLGQKTEVYPTGENIFGDYEPKRSPDTILEFAPQLTDEFDELPVAEQNNLIALLNLFEHYKTEAEKNPGQWEEGNMILGAKQEEYKPSKEELLLNEIGNRIKSVVDKTAGQINVPGRIIEYKNFTFTHVDVMGSGRFFYVEEIQNITVKLME